VGISSENPYLFARLNSNTPLSGNDDLKQIVKQCPGIQHPERIASTGLRRYMATVSHVFLPYTAVTFKQYTLIDPIYN